MNYKGKITTHFSWEELIQNQDNYTVEWTKQRHDDFELLLEMLEEFRTWVGRSMSIHGCIRTSAYNAKVKGNAKSNHLNFRAVDFHIDGIDFGEKFVKYATKWKNICEKHGVVGEAGLYTWGFHFGFQTYSKTFYNWDSRSGTQKNMAFKI